MVFDNAGGTVGTGASFAATSADGKFVLDAAVTGATPVTACEGPAVDPPEADELLFGDGGGGITSLAEDAITSSLLIGGACEASTASEVGRVTIANILCAHGTRAGTREEDHLDGVPEEALGRPRHADFFTIDVWTGRGLTRFAVLFIIELSTRRVEIAGITSAPDAAWMSQVTRTRAGKYRMSVQIARLF